MARRGPTRAELFLDEFLLPLCSGDTVHVGDPLDREDLAELVQVFVPLEPGQSDVLVQHSRAVEQVCARHVAAIWAAADTWGEGTLDGQLMALGAAAHNLLFLSHPSLERVSVTRRARARVAGVTEGFLGQPPPADDRELVRRHVLLGNLLQVQRVDVKVRFWAGSRSFRGTEPPARLMAWPRLRGVVQEHNPVRWLATGLSDAQLELLRLFLDATPLSDLLLPHRQAPPFSWLRVYRYLRSPPLCRLVCYHYLELGLQVVGPALAGAFWTLVDEPGCRDKRLALRLSAQLVAYLLAVSLVGGDADLARSQVPLQAQHPELALGAVLLAARNCDLLPGPEALGYAPVRDGLEQLSKAWEQALGPAGEDLSGRLLKGLYQS